MRHLYRVEEARPPHAADLQRMPFYVVAPSASAACACFVNEWTEAGRGREEPSEIVVTRVADQVFTA